jgi:putative ATP-dependent endonuclease of the OLD family
MLLHKLTIKDFRGVKTAEIFLKTHMVFLGSNNIGKSTIIDAIGLLLGKEKVVRSLSDYDFFGGSPKPSDRILVTGLLGGFPSNDPSKYPTWFNDNNGGTITWFNPQTKELAYGDHKDGFFLCTEIAFCARFDEDDLEFKSIRYFSDGEGDPFEDETSLKKVSSNHIKELGFFLLPSNRTWERIISFGSELFRKVIKFQDAVPGKTVVKLRDDLRNTPEGIEKQEPLAAIVTRINNELEGFIGKDETGLNFLPTAGDIDSVLHVLTPYLPGKQKTNLPLGRHGSGIISLQTLLLLMEFGRFRQQQKENFILAAEEPEIHLQPSLHRRLVNRIRGITQQSFVSTHSPEIASYYRPSEIIILRNQDGIMNPFILSEQIPQPNALMRLFTIYRTEICEALMNKMVIVPEGLTEFRWFKLLMGSCITAEGWEAYKEETPHTKVFGVLPTQDAKVVETFSEFASLVDTLIPIIDGDNTGNSYAQELLKLTAPPSIIFQLPTKFTLESLIAWILSPQSQNDFKRLTEIFNITISSHEMLLQELLRNKQNWRLHEGLMQYIIENSESVKRAQSIINAIALSNTTSDNNKCFWQKNETLSTPTTTVFQLQLN